MSYIMGTSSTGTYIISSFDDDKKSISLISNSDDLGLRVPFHDEQGEDVLSLCIDCNVDPY